MRSFKYAALALALLPALAVAQTSIFSTNFSTGERVSNNANYDVGDWTLASTKAITGIGYAANSFTFGMAGTTSGLVQTQTRFTSTPVVLAETEVLRAKIVFTNTNNILAAGINSSLTFGLYDSGGNNPTAGLESGSGTGTLSATASNPLSTGFAQTWEGYVARLSPTGSPTSGNNSIYTRPVQSGVDTSSQNQDVLFNNVGSGAYDTPTGTVVGSGTSTLAVLTNGSRYVAELSITRTTATAYNIVMALKDGTETTTLQSTSATASGANFLSNLSFDSMALGYRASGTSLATSIRLESASVTYISAIPEPTTSAALSGLVGIVALGLRRKRRA